MTYVQAWDKIPVRDVQPPISSTAAAIADLLEWSIVGFEAGGASGVDHAILNGDVVDSLGSFDVGMAYSLAEAVRSIQASARYPDDPSPSPLGVVGDVFPDDREWDGRNPFRVRAAGVPPATAIVKATVYGGYPVAIGIGVSERWDDVATAATGYVQPPDYADLVVGGVALVIVGWDDTNGVYIVRNSQGTGWGKDGYGTMPYPYVTRPDLCMEAICLRVILPPVKAGG